MRVGLQSVLYLPVILQLVVATNFTFITIIGWWFGTCFIFPYVGTVIIPSDFHSYFSEE